MPAPSHPHGLHAALFIASLASCESLMRPPPTTPIGGAYPFVQASPSGEAPPNHIVTAARENLDTSSGGPACLDPLAQSTSARQRCAALHLAGPTLSCVASCVRSHLPDEADRAHAGALVAVRFSLDARGRFEHATALHEPGCGLGRAAPDALRECCEPMVEATSATQSAEGCHVIEFTSAR